MIQPIEQAAEILSTAKYAVALTGAGISVESGIPPFRGKGGLWEKLDPMKVAHIDAFLKDPEMVWKLLIKDMKILLDTARPNPGHSGLADLEQLGILKPSLPRTWTACIRWRETATSLNFMAILPGNPAWSATGVSKPRGLI